MSYKRLTETKKINEYCYTVECGEHCEDCYVGNLYARLAEFENDLERGKLVRLPCKVGDMVYFVNHYRPTPRIEEHKVYSFSFGKDGLFLYIGFDTVISVNDVCFTKAEAEKKLEELSKNR